jgi:hypothetical protein
MAAPHVQQHIRITRFQSCTIPTQHFGSLTFQCVVHLLARRLDKADPRSSDSITSTDEQISQASATAVTWDGQIPECWVQITSAGDAKASNKSSALQPAPGKHSKLYLQQLRFDGG